MPIHVKFLDAWRCASWGDDVAEDLLRVPKNTNAGMVSCSDSYVSVFGISMETHLLQCPAGCLNEAKTDVYGCGVYTTDTPICLAAIHAGTLTDAGGIVTVYGRVGLPTFERCSRNSVVSVERNVGLLGEHVTVSSIGTVFDSYGVMFPHAYHFNNLETTREFISLQHYEVVPSKDEDAVDGKPWTRIEATVSMRLAGIELHDEKLRLRQSQSGTMTEADTCTLVSDGVLCQSSGSLLIMLDFCASDVCKA